MPKRSVTDFFQSYSKHFNAIYANNNTPFNNLINKYFRKSMKVRYAKTMAGCNPIEGRSVIDIGCGPGLYTVTLAKNGASYACGIDFAKEMIDLAKRMAIDEGVSQKCEFILADFMAYPIKGQFDYSIVMGFMDYAPDPKATIDKVLSLTKLKAFFSFPVSGGILAWQRKLRYKRKCDLFMYNKKQLQDLFKSASCRNFSIEKISRDFFVTVNIK